MAATCLGFCRQSSREQPSPSLRIGGAKTVNAFPTHLMRMEARGCGKPAAALIATCATESNLTRRWRTSTTIRSNAAWSLPRWIGRGRPLATMHMTIAALSRSNTDCSPRIVKVVLTRGWSKCGSASRCTVLALQSVRSFKMNQHCPAKPGQCHEKDRPWMGRS